eukprot:TRINITY_DN3905_c0_g1_i3.p1 TRINITY_DN3905_c0_g1~~TRINITY_DN3905_c0_g1_i3.p1  ORF type:complete len:267 (+),score=105.70 TRINITY_DN3905_c0_g1_i3:65-865(+)
MAAPMQWREVSRGPAGADTMIFLHGWPDDDGVFAKQYPAFAGSHRVVAATLPGYERRGGGAPFFGIHRGVLRDMYYATVQAAMKDAPGKPILVGHDWGSMVTMSVLFKYPEAAQKVVLLDVGGHIAMPVSAVLFVLFYWSVNIAFWCLPSFLGSPLTKVFSEKALHAPDYGQRKTNAMNYMYVREVLMLLRGAPKDLRGWRPSLPTLFLYGTKKPMMFHSPKWEQGVAAAGGRVAAVDGGHWFLYSNADATNREIQRFVAPNAPKL